MVGEGLEIRNEKPDHSFMKSKGRKRRSKQDQNTRKDNTFKGGVDVETTQEICTIDPVEKYESPENSFQYQNTSNTSMDDYDEKVSDLMTRTENGWGCRECPYSSRNKGHVQEHVESHIGGVSKKCELCDKTFRTRKRLSNHVYKLHSS